MRAFSTMYVCPSVGKEASMCADECYIPVVIATVNNAPHLAWKYKSHISYRAPGLAESSSSNND